jgi:hypothetical protein
MSSLDTIQCAPHSQAEKDAVLAQLEKLVSHPVLKSSRRCPALLRFIVEHQLEGGTGKLKERMIGIAVFGRDSDYDNNADPVVRTTANDLRKRLAQYYYSAGHENELRISLPAGSYVAEFRQPEGVHVEPIIAAPVSAVAAATPAPSAAAVARVADSSWKRYLVSICLFVALVIAIVWRQPTRTPRSLNEFWAPVDKSRAVLVSVGTWNVSSITADMPPHGVNLDIHDLLPMSDAVAFSRITAFFGETRVPFQAQSAKTTTLTDLTESPVVLIGAIDNQWTMRVTDPLRFHFVHNASGPGWAIADRRNSDQQFANGPGDALGATKDHAIIGRLINGTSGQMSVVVAGLGAAGTTVASQFVTDSRYMDYLFQQVPRDFGSKNLEAVISVQVVDGRPGAPHIEAVETW